MAKAKQRAGNQAARGRAPAGRPAPVQPAAGKTPAAGKPGPASSPAGQSLAGQGQRPGAPARPAVPRAKPEPPPRSVQIAVWLMYTGAGLAALDLIATLATIGSARGELHRANPRWDAVQLTAGVHALILSTSVSWVLTIAVWLIMARTNLAGRAWARNVATVLSALSTLTFILYLNAPGSLFGKVLLAPMWLVGVAAGALLWRRTSTAYIRAGAA
jgi:hypothetical protein